MKKIIRLALPAVGAFLAVMAAAQIAAPSADAILDKVDQNAVPGTKILTAEMTIHSRRDSRTLRSKSWVQGQEKAFTEYLDPPRRIFGFQAVVSVRAVAADKVFARDLERYVA